MSRREARIERKNEKLLKQQEKSVRLAETVSNEIVPRSQHSPSDSQSPRASANPDNIMQMHMSYELFSCADREGEWSWGQHRNWCQPDAKAADACIIRATMLEMSCLTWAEIFSQMTGRKNRHKKHHSQSWDSLCNEAQERWLEIERSEEELFRFRTGSKSRIWGFRQGRVFNVVWWDAEHQVYPTEKSS